ncbi:MAG: hypothetical protein ACRDZO_07695 [Egibacteraceae bacterium]
MTGPGREPPQHPRSALVVLAPPVVTVFTPCHAAAWSYPSEEAAPGVTFEGTCPVDGRRWLVRLHADASAESGLVAEWEARR